MVRKRKVNISTSREGSGRPDCVLLDAGEPEDFEGEEGIPGEGADTRHFVHSKGSVAFEGGSGAQGAEGLFCRAGARQSVGRRDDLGTAGGRSDEAVGASQGRRHSQQHPFQSLLPFPVAGEGHHCPNRSRSSAVAPAEVLPDNEIGTPITPS